jgi:hypothetical protein
MPEAVPVSVVETPEFLTAAGRIMGDEERAALVDHLAWHPTSGDLVPGTGGVRKLRWALPGRGRRGGARVIYFFHSSDVPLFALTAFAKSARADLSQADRNSFRRLTRLLVESYGRGSRREIR